MAFAEFRMAKLLYEQERLTPSVTSSLRGGRAYEFTPNLGEKIDTGTTGPRIVTERSKTTDHDEQERCVELRAHNTAWALEPAPVRREHEADHEHSPHQHASGTS